MSTIQILNIFCALFAVKNYVFNIFFNSKSHKMAAGEKFLDIHMYMTCALKKEDVKAVALQVSLTHIHTWETYTRVHTHTHIHTYTHTHTHAHTYRRTDIHTYTHTYTYTYTYTYTHTLLHTYTHTHIHTCTHTHTHIHTYSNSRITVELLGNYCRITVELLHNLNYCRITVELLDWTLYRCTNSFSPL